VIETVDFDAAKAKLRIALRPGAVGGVAGYLMKQQSGRQ
jgi:hypothetical protein